MGVEISELQAIDFSFGKFISDAFSGISASASAPKHFREFIARDTDKQVYRADFMDAATFINAFRASKSGLPALPVVFYYRRPGLSAGDDRNISIINRNATAPDADGEDIDFSFSVLPVVLSYHLTFCSWDKPALDKIVLCWYNRISKHDRFDTAYKIEDGIIEEVPVIIKDHKTFEITDASVQKGEGRLFACEADYRLETQIFTGESVTLPETIEVEAQLVGFCGVSAW